MTRRPAVAALSLAALLAVAGPTFAQTTRPNANNRNAGGGNGAAPLKRLDERLAGLDLTPEQKQQVDQVKAEAAESIRDMAGELKGLSPKDRREKLQDTLDDTRQKIRSILTPEQLAKFKDLQNPAGSGRRGLKKLQTGAAAAGDKAGNKAGDQSPEMSADKSPDAAAPTTRPDSGRPAAGRPGAEGPMLARMKEALADLDLTPEQKTKTDAILADAAEQAKTIRESAGGDRDAALQKAIGLAQSVRTQLAAVLTPEQKEKLASKMAALRGGPNAGGARGNANGGGALGGRRGRPGVPPTTSPSATPPTSGAKVDGAAVAPVADGQATPAVGDAAPAFNLKRLGSGAMVTNKFYVGKPLVLAFGSYSSPAFRDRIPRLEAIKNQYRGRAAVLIVYTKEEHPADGWQVQRNTDDKIEINQPTTMIERLAAATQLRDKTKTTLDIAVDDMTDAVATAYGSRPQGAAVISRYGKIIGTQTFCDPSGLPRMIDDALKAKE